MSGDSTRSCSMSYRHGRRDIHNALSHDGVLVYWCACVLVCWWSYESPPFGVLSIMARLVRHFTDLEVYQRSADLAARTYVMTGQFPPRERYRMSDQFLRSARSVPALIAEAWGRRWYVRAFREKLTQAWGEAMEAQAWLDQAKRCAFISENEFRDMFDQWQGVEAMLMRMIQEAHRFRGRGGPV